MAGSEDFTVFEYPAQELEVQRTGLDRLCGTLATLLLLTWMVLIIPVAWMVWSAVL